MLTLLMLLVVFGFGLALGLAWASSHDRTAELVSAWIVRARNWLKYR
jgi:hypothetical protein